jgi:hypothetical protein
MVAFLAQRHGTALLVYDAALSRVAGIAGIEVDPASLRA